MGERRIVGYAGLVIAAWLGACQLVYPPGDIHPSDDGGSLSDATADAGATRDGDAVDAADPGIACGSANFCRPDTEVCCYKHCSGGIGSLCAPANAGDCNDSCMTLLTCDSTRNCASSPGTICCAILNSGLTIESTACVPLSQCTAGAFYRVLCDPGAAAACPNGATCDMPDSGDPHPACAGL